MKSNEKNLKIWCGRSDLIGDTIMALPMLYYFEKQYPNSYKYWSILRKCSQAAPLYFNHPLIDKIVISDYNEGFGDNDRLIVEDCDVVVNTRPEHKYIDWYNQYSMLQETWLMAGLSEIEFDQLNDFQKIPKLYKWFDIKKYEKAIAIHCFAGYGRDNHRSPNKEWWDEIVNILMEQGYQVFRFGHPNEPYLQQRWAHGFFDCRNASFIEQIQMTLGCNCYVGTDSGFSLAIGAYSHPQITLLTNWNIGHISNFYALQPINKNNISIFNPIDQEGCSGIPHEKILETIKSVIL